MKMAHGFEWGPLVLPPLSGETCWVHDCMAGEEGGGEGEEECGGRKSEPVQSPLP